MSFEHAPVTKGLMVCCAFTSILVGLFDVKHYFHLQLVPHLSRHHQYWRLGAHHLAFSNSSDLFVAELILYNIGVQIERQFGSLKFASYAVVTTLLTTVLEFFSLILLHRVGLNHIALGPSALIFSILYQYSRIVPPAYSFRIFGLPLNNKSLVYVLGFQLAVSRLPGSAAVAIIGVLTGQLYRSDLTGLKSYRLPPSIVGFSVRCLSPLIGAIRPPRRSNRALPDNVRAPTRTSVEPRMPPNEEVITTARTLTPAATATGRASNPADAGETGSSVVREWVNELTGRTEHANAGIRVPTEAEISQLTSMFPDIQREVIIRVLQRSPPNLQSAVETLLNSPS